MSVPDTWIYSTVIDQKIRNGAKKTYIYRERFKLDIMLIVGRFI